MEWSKEEELGQVFIDLSETFKDLIMYFKKLDLPVEVHKYQELARYYEQKAFDIAYEQEDHTPNAIEE